MALHNYFRYHVINLVLRNINNNNNNNTNVIYEILDLKCK